MPDDRAQADNSLPPPPISGSPLGPGAQAGGEQPDGDQAGGDQPGAPSQNARRRRGSRGGARNRSGIKPPHSAPATGSKTPNGAASDSVSGQPELPDLPWEGVPGGRNRPVTPRVKQRNGQRDPKAAPAKDPAETAKPATTAVASSGPDAESEEPTRSRKQKGRRGSQRRPIPPGDYTMCVHVRSKATQIAVLDGRTLIEHYVSHADDDAAQINGNIYLGRVQNVLPGMEAAFVDIATPKNAVLYRGDVQIDRDLESTESTDVGALRIEELLRNGQLVICQVTKNPIGAKGARLTQDVSLAGRFVVLVPNSDTYGISKRLPDDERKRLRGVLDTVKPADHGIIVRTAASGADAEELRRDVASLVQRWTQITTKAAKLKGPALLHREPNLAVRIIREEFSDAYRRVVIDDERVYEEVRSYVETISPELASRIELFETSSQPLPIFEQFHVHEQLHKAIDRKVWLPSGGSIIIERTEALTVIDVNTGKNVGSTSLEETVFRNNLEAATEIARQLRLRDIGGIIVIDFIDMEIKANRASLVTHFREELGRDKTRTQVFEISDLGLVEMTRKRISEGLLEALSDTCPTCNGRGFVFDPNVLTD